MSQKEILSLFIFLYSIPIGIAAGSVFRFSLFTTEAYSEIKSLYSEVKTIPAAAREFSYFVNL
jgi:ABC-type anion transport system duplicated permease subunit